MLFLILLFLLELPFVVFHFWALPLTELKEINGVKILINGKENQSFKDEKVSLKNAFVRIEKTQNQTNNKQENTNSNKNETKNN